MKEKKKKNVSTCDRRVQRLSHTLQSLKDRPANSRKKNYYQCKQRPQIITIELIPNPVNGVKIHTNHSKS